MPIKYVKTSREKYRNLASSTIDVTALTGRPTSELGRTTTNLRAVEIKNLIDRYARKKLDRFLDVGCGDATLLKLLNQKKNIELFGVLPSSEEVMLTKQSCFEFQNIKISVGDLSNLPLEDATMDAISMNGVVHGIGFEIKDLQNALLEAYRVLKYDGTYIIGELPVKDEFKDRTYSTSILKYLYWVLRQRGIKRFSSECWQIIRAFFSNSHVYIISDPKGFHIKSDELKKLAKDIGFEYLLSQKSLILKDGHKTADEFRYDYVLRKI